MKFAVVLLVLLPLALSGAVDKRGVLEFLGLDGILDLDELRRTAQHILDILGSDATETQCETTCHNILAVNETHLLHTLCTPLCRSFQTVVHMLHLTPRP